MSCELSPPDRVFLSSFPAASKRRRSLDLLHGPPSKRRRASVIVIDSSDEEDYQADEPRHGQDDDEDDDEDDIEDTRRDETRRQRLKGQLRERFLPHVHDAIQLLANAKLNRNELAIQAILELTKSRQFRDQLVDQASGILTPNEDDIANEASQVVNYLALQPRFIVEPPTCPDSIDSRRRLPVNPLLKSTPLRSRSDATYQSYQRPAVSNDSPATNFRLHLVKKPYLTLSDRKNISLGIIHVECDLKELEHEQVLYHVDFTQDEIRQMIDILVAYLPNPDTVPRTVSSLRNLCVQYDIASIIKNKLPGRSINCVKNYCADLKAGNHSPVHHAQALSLKKTSQAPKKGLRQVHGLGQLLFAREMEGHSGFGRTRAFRNFQNEASKIRVDQLKLVSEYTNCAGDISTMTWTPAYNILCGTTTHSDPRHQQYNKQGNLLLCSTSLDQLKAFSDHRIPRPLVAKGENSTPAMRQSQDPWVYASVVCSDYDLTTGYGFTSSFDGTVKIWTIDEDGKAMNTLATWTLGGRVNFVAAAKDGSGRIAVGTDVPTNAIRIYQLTRGNEAQSPYQTISCTRNDAEGSDKWAYFPATLQWGRSYFTQHLLLVGYSPRCFSDHGEDNDIPEDKRNTGEILLWDAERGRRLSLLTATSANVFEVAWHPTLPRFIVGTSPCGAFDHGVQTQVHVFQCDEIQRDVYAEFQKLDCRAADINELTIMPNSVRDAYVTAACTDGRVYVWDTAQGDKPIHVLSHGSPIDEIFEDREKEDTGVKFTAWADTCDRFYTGSSDGVVKVWNVRNQHRPFICNLLEAPGSISCGQFSPDYSWLAIGDATGRLFTFSIDSKSSSPSKSATVVALKRHVRQPKSFIPHCEPAPPNSRVIVEQDDSELSLAAYAKHTYIDTGQVVLHPNPVIGAVKGPNYAASGLYRMEAHIDGDPLGSLQPIHERMQRESIDSSLRGRQRSMRRLKESVAVIPSLLCAMRDQQHRKNMEQDFSATSLAADELAALIREGALLSISEDEDWRFEYEQD